MWAVQAEPGVEIPSRPVVEKCLTDISSRELGPSFSVFWAGNTLAFWLPDLVKCRSFLPLSCWPESSVTSLPGPCLGTKEGFWSQLQTLGLSGVLFCYHMSSMLVVPASLPHLLPALVTTSGQAEDGHMLVLFLMPESKLRDMAMDTCCLTLNVY